jgi:hypothetical protein
MRTLTPYLLTQYKNLPKQQNRTPVHEEYNFSEHWSYYISLWNEILEHSKVLTNESEHN